MKPSRWQALYRQATAAAPDVGLDEASFAAACERHFDDPDELPPALAGDLLVAAGALAHHPAALARLRQALADCLPQLRSFRLAPEEQRDLVQDTLGELIGLGRPPKLASYSARGPLGAWLRVLLTRAVLARRAPAASPVDLDEVVLGAAPEGSAEGELELLKRRCAGLFSAAFKAALASLTPRQRNLLRQHYLDQLSLEALATLYRAHRATIARHLADARAELLQKTRDQLSLQLGVGRLEVDSLMRLVSSRLDISTTFFLSTAQAPPDV